MYVSLVFLHYTHFFLVPAGDHFQPVCNPDSPLGNSRGMGEDTNRTDDDFMGHLFSASQSHILISISALKTTHFNALYPPPCSSSTCFFSNKHFSMEILQPQKTTPRQVKCEKIAPIEEKKATEPKGNSTHSCNTLTHCFCC